MNGSSAITNRNNQANEYNEGASIYRFGAEPA
jgi:hypothetical protein